MAMYRPKDLHGFLNELGRAPKKSLSQNFLIDGNIIRKIVKAAKIQPGDKILEIGPGPGSLTEALLDAGAAVIAVERDEILAQALQRLKTPTNQLVIFAEDIIAFIQQGKIDTLLYPGEKLKVVANLPYHLTSPIIGSLVPLNAYCTSIIVMVQEEVARRFTAKPRTKEYSSFTIFLEFYSDPRYAFAVSRNCFFPAPKVDSAIVCLDLKEPPGTLNHEAFFVLTRTAFKQRRKMLKSSLKELYAPETTMLALEKIGCNPQARPEELSLQQFIELYFELSHQKTF